MLYYISKIRIRPYRLAVRTAPSHGANSGSSPDKVTKIAVFWVKNAQKAAFFRVFDLTVPQKMGKKWGSLPSIQLLTF